MNVPGIAHYNALSLGYAYINNFLEGLKASMIMHPSTQSFYSFSSNSCLPLHPAELFSTLFRATPLPIPNPRKRTEKRASSIGWEAYSNFALDKCIETSLCQKEKRSYCSWCQKAGARVNDTRGKRKWIWLLVRGLSGGHPQGRGGF